MTSSLCNFSKITGFPYVFHIEVHLQMSEAFPIRFAIFHHTISRIRKKTGKIESSVKNTLQRREDAL